MTLTAVVSHFEAAARRLAKLEPSDLPGAAAVAEHLAAGLRDADYFHRELASAGAVGGTLEGVARMDALRHDLSLLTDWRGPLAAVVVWGLGRVVPG